MARILLVENNPHLLTSMYLTLAGAGHSVMATNSGADAVCLLAIKPTPDLLIVDLLLPGVDGFSVMDQLGPTAPPVIVMSGSEEAICRLDPKKATRVLRKAFNTEQLMEAVNLSLALSIKEPTT